MSRIILQYQDVAITRYHCGRTQGDFAATAGSINDIGGHGIACGIATQPLDNFQPLWGMRRSRTSSHASLSSENVKGSPPDRSTSRIVGVASIYAMAPSHCPMEKRYSPPGYPTMRDHARTCAVATVDRTKAGHQKQHPIGIAMYQTWHRTVAILTERISGFLRGAYILAIDWDNGRS